MGVVDQLSKTVRIKRDKLFRWFADQGEATRLEAIKLQGEMAKRYRSLYRKEHHDEYYYSMLVLAINKLHWEERAIEQKGSLSSDEAAALNSRRLARIKEMRKPSPSLKREMIRVRFFETIKALRTEGLSWQKIAFYIEKYHKQKFSSVYLHRIYTALQEEIEATEK